MQHKSRVPCEYKISKNCCIFMHKTYELCVKKSLWSTNRVKINMREDNFFRCHFLWLPGVPSLFSLQELPAFASDFVWITWMCLSWVLFSFKVLEFAWDTGELCENTAQEFPGHSFRGWRCSANIQNIFPFHSKMPIFKGNCMTHTQW